MTVALFALTGFGNRVLRALVDAGQPPDLLITRREAGPYPYHAETDLAEEAAALGIPTAFGRAGEEQVAEAAWDLVLVATYHRILPAPVVYAAPMAINFHPSLLPRWRGPSPIYAALRNGDAESGMTAHLLGERLDDGPILIQSRLRVSSEDDQGTLRDRLSDLGATLAVDIVLRLLHGGPLPHPVPQSADGASWASRPDEKDLVIDLGATVGEIARQVRALSPWPLAKLEGSPIRRVAGVRAPRGGDIGVICRLDGMLTVRCADGEMDLLLG